MEAFLIPGLILRRKPERWKWKEYESKSRYCPSSDLCFLLGNYSSPFTMATPHFSQLGVHNSIRLIPRWPGINKHTSWVFWGLWHTEDLMKACVLEDDLSWRTYTQTYMSCIDGCADTYMSCIGICAHTYMSSVGMCAHTYMLTVTIFRGSDHWKNRQIPLVNSDQRVELLHVNFFYYAQNRASTHWLVWTIAF